MRRALIAILVASCIPTLAAQTARYTLPEYLAPQYTAPGNAPSRIVVAGKSEPGERLVVTGRTLEGNTPVPGVSLYVFHTDKKGDYAPDVDLHEGELNPRLHGVLRTDAQGGYEFETTRPGYYLSSPAHVHYIVNAGGYEPLLLSVQFDDDPLVVRWRKIGKPLVEPYAFKMGPCQSRPDCVLTQPIRRDAQGVFHVVRDIQMVRR